MHRLLTVGLCALLACNEPCPDITPPIPGSGVESAAYVCNAAATCTQLTYCLDLAGSDPSVETIVQSAEQDWQISLRDAVVFTCPGMTNFTVQMKDESWFNAHGVPADRGWTPNTDIYLNSDYTCGSQVLHHVIRHELGHLFGMVHSPNIGDVMYYSYVASEPTVTIQTGDVEAYFAGRQCCPPPL